MWLFTEGKFHRISTWLPNEFFELLRIWWFILSYLCHTKPQPESNEWIKYQLENRAVLSQNCWPLITGIVTITDPCTTEPRAGTRNTENWQLTVYQSIPLYSRCYIMVEAFVCCPIKSIRSSENFRIKYSSLLWQRFIKQRYSCYFVMISNINHSTRMLCANCEADAWIVTCKSESVDDKKFR